MEIQLPLKRGPPPLFGLYLLWPNGWMGQDTTWYEGRPRPRPQRVTWGPSSPPSRKGHSPQFQAYVYCGQTLADLSYCWTLVNFWGPIISLERLKLEPSNFVRSRLGLYQTLVSGWQTTTDGYLWGLHDPLVNFGPNHIFGMGKAMQLKFVVLTDIDD